MSDIFTALADSTRRVILDELTERDGQTLFEICSRLTTRHQISSSRQAISQHLATLEAAGLLTTRREGRYKFHYFAPRPLERISQRWPYDRTGRPGGDHTRRPTEPGGHHEGTAGQRLR